MAGTAVGTFVLQILLAREIIPLRDLRKDGGGDARSRNTNVRPTRGDSSNLRACLACNARPLIVSLRHGNLLPAGALRTTERYFQCRRVDGESERDVGEIEGFADPRGSRKHRRRL